VALSLHTTSGASLRTGGSVVTRTSRISILAIGLVAAAATFWPIDAAAQYRGRRAVVRVAVAPVYYPGYYYPSAYWGFGWGWGWPGYGWGYPPYPYYWGRYDRTGAARLEVRPREAQVFVDGYFVGEVDDFDGTFQRLRVEAGEHELSFYLDGYRTERHKVLFRRDGTLNMSLVMQPLAPGETSERPVPDPAAAARQPGPARPQERGPGPEAGGPPAGAPNQPYGTLAIRVQPADAEVFIDGQQWDGPDAADRLEVQLLEGQHRIEVRREGFRSYTANLRIRAGETRRLNVSLNQE
jgi:PEGA domain